MSLFCSFLTCTFTFKFAITFYAYVNESIATRYQDVDARGRSSSGSSDGYVALFVRMLGLDNDPLDREQAVVALWKYSLGGKKCIDNVKIGRAHV